jgi:hypothetical protein
MPSPDRSADPRLERVTLIAWLFDQLFRVPGTRFRFGIDAIIGLIPGAGDLVGSLVGAYGLWVANRLGAPASVQGRMLLNLAIDALFGVVPLLGDIFDAAFKAHVRNRVLLEKWLLNPGPTRRRSTGLLLVLAIAMLAILVGTVWLTIAVLSWLFGLITS